MTRHLWALDAVVAAVGGVVDGGAPVAEPEITGVSIDTRSLSPGDLFVPLTDARDGHEFVTAAFGRGAAAALVRESYARKPGDGVLIRVPHAGARDAVLVALEALGKAARARLETGARVIAVTGSAGKTGTKEMLRTCLEACASSPDRVHAPEKSFNNHWGVPLTLARMPADAEYAVLEIGMNHAGEIRPLTRMARPDIAIVTNVLPVHVGNFADGIEGVAKAKAEIFEGLQAGGTAIVLRDSPFFALLAERAEAQGARVVTFGSHAEADVRLVGVDAVRDGVRDAQRVSAIAGRDSITFALGMVGSHLAMNALSVLAALRVLGCDLGRATAGLAGVEAAAGRGARIRLDGEDGEVLLLDESYNANPASMAAALANLVQLGDPLVRRKVAILGDMLELGAEARRYHTDLADAAAHADLVLCCGPNMRHLFEALPASKRGAWAPGSTELVPHVLATLRPGDAIMVKGSLGSRMAPVVEAIKKRFARGAAGG